MAERPIRIANVSGFYGDRLSAVREQLDGGPVDVLTGDYLAELTMLILWKARQRDPGAGYAATFVRQMEDALGDCVRRGVKVVTNAGGLAPAALAARLREIARAAGVDAAIAHVEGDDVLADIPRLQAAGHPLAHLDSGAPLASLDRPLVSANAYLGGWGIARALAEGADVVVTGRVTDAALVVGPAAWWHGWARDDWDALAGAVVAGHVIECGAQATGGNYAFFTEVPGLEHPGFPIAEVDDDGSSLITKHPGTGGLVSVETVTAQLLYEVGAPAYPNPDAVALLDTVQLSDDGPDRVRISAVRGLPAPSGTKVSANYVGGYRNAMTLVLTGLDLAEKAALVERSLRRRFGTDSLPDELVFDTVGSGDDQALLVITAKDPDRRKVGRAFSSAVTELVLASYPGFFATSPPDDEREYGVYWPALVPASEVPHVVVLDDGRRIAIEPPPPSPPVAGFSPPPVPADRDWGAIAEVPLGRVFGARSGDKGGNANVGVWARTDAAFAWLAHHLTTERLQQLLPETAPLRVDRHVFANIRAVNFVVHGLLGEGVASSTRFDAQAKSLGEELRAQLVTLPTSLF